MWSGADRSAFMASELAPSQVMVNFKVNMRTGGWIGVERKVAGTELSQELEGHG